MNVSETSPFRTNTSTWTWQPATSVEQAGSQGFLEAVTTQLSTRPAPRKKFSMPMSFDETDQMSNSRRSSISYQTTPAAGSKRKQRERPIEAAMGSKRSSIAMPGTMSPPVAASPCTRPPSNSDTFSGPTSRLLAPADAEEAQVSPRTAHMSQSTSRAIGDLDAKSIFPIQVGSKLFQVSGLSINSDGPSYFTKFFEEQLKKSGNADIIPTLYIDRDPEIFHDIVLHLQGYHIEPRDGPHFVKLFADAQYYNLPRLTTQLFNTLIYIRIGEEDFQIPRDLFDKPGDSPNYFSLDISVFFSSSSDTSGTIPPFLPRPPSILPPSVPNRSAKIFKDLLHILKGYEVEIRNDEHRSALLRDARYFHLKGLEQRLIAHSITYNLARQRSEIRIRLEDIRQSGISFMSDDPASSHSSAAASPAATNSSTSSTAHIATAGWVSYKRPYVDAEAHSLIIEISTRECATLALAPAAPNATSRLGRVTLYGDTLARMTSLLSVVATRLGLPNVQPLGTTAVGSGGKAVSLPSSPLAQTTQTKHVRGDELMKVRIGPDAHVSINGRTCSVTRVSDEEIPSTVMETSQPLDQRRSDISEAGVEIILRRSQWRIRVQPVNGGGAETRTGKGSDSITMEAILGAVKLDGFTNERARNAAIDFLQ